MAGGFAASLNRTGSTHPAEEQVMLDIARMRSDQIAAMYRPQIQVLADGTEVTTGPTAQYGEELTRLKENLAALEAHSQWENLSEQEKAHALSLTNQAANIEAQSDKVKAVGLEDKAKQEQLGAIQEELNTLFEAKTEVDKPVSIPSPEQQIEGDVQWEYGGSDPLANEITRLENNLRKGFLVESTKKLLEQATNNPILGGDQIQCDDKTVIVFKEEKQIIAVII